MPKLDKKTAKAADKVEAWGPGGGGSLLPEGRYAGRLAKVESYAAREGGSGYESWRWEFRHLHNEDGAEQRGQQSSFTSMSPKALGNLKAHFEGLGYTLETDTDEIVEDGAWAVLYVVQEVAERGKNAGKTVNRVNGISAFDEDEWDFDPDSIAPDEPEAGTKGGGGGSDDQF